MNDPRNDSQRYVRYGKALTVEDLTHELQEAKRRWRKMSVDKQNALARQVGILEPYLLQKQRLGDNKREMIIDHLAIKSPQTFYNRLDRCEMLHRLFPEENIAYALVNLAGRPRQELFNEEQELLIVGAYLYDKWDVVLPNEKITRSRDRMTIASIHHLLTHAYPDLDVTEQQIARFLKQKEQEKHVLFALGRDGLKKVFQEYVPKLPNNVHAPHIRWQSDARILPVVVLLDNGKSGKQKKEWKSTVTLVVVIDDYTQCILNWCLVPRKVEDEIDPDKLRGADFTNHHVRLIMAGAMKDFQVRPQVWYTDRGSQFMAIVDFISWLTSNEKQEQQIISIKGFPGHPWSRGKVELVQKLVNACLHKLSGFVHDEDDRQEWKHATKATNIKFEDLESVISKYIDTWNATMIQKDMSRLDVIRSTSYTPLPAPADDRLVIFAQSDMWGEVTVRDIGIPIKGEFYKPEQFKTDEDYQRLMNLVGTKIRYSIIPRITGDVVLANLAGDTWEKIILTKINPPSTQRHSKNQWVAITSEQDQLNTYRNKFAALCDTLFGAVPQPYAVGDELKFPSSPNEASLEEVPQDTHVGQGDAPNTREQNVSEHIQDVPQEPNTLQVPDKEQQLGDTSEPHDKPIKLSEEQATSSVPSALELARQRRQQARKP